MIAYGARIDLAQAFVAEAFRGVYRKQTSIPYLTHLWAVAALVGEHGGDEDQLIAALLHDVLEDVPHVTEVDLERRFGERVARLVVGMSDTVVHPKPPWQERKERYLAHLAHASPDLKLICCADKLHNCRSVVRDHKVLGDAIFDRFNAPKSATLWYNRELVAALGTGWSHPILDEFREAVAELHVRSGVPA